MRKIVLLLVLVAFVAGLIFISSDTAFSLWGRDKEKEEKAKETKAAETEEPEEPKLLYKFKDAEDMATFEQLYISKQATFGRMGVLQAYFAMEQNNLVELDRQMQEVFGFTMDPNKIYDLNRDTMEIKEVESVAPVSPAPAE